MNPNNPTPQPQPQQNDTNPFGTQPVAPPMPQPEVQPQYVQPEVNPVPVAQPTVEQVPVQPQQFAQPIATQQTDYSQSTVSEKPKILALLDEKAGLISLVLYGIAFAILSIATIIHLNNIINEVQKIYASYGANFPMPSLFESLKEVVTSWTFVNGISAWWWVLSLLPALGVAAYGLYINRLKDVPAIITVVLVAEVYLNLIIK